jgi:hypothetical protein
MASLCSHSTCIRGVWFRIRALLSGGFTLETLCEIVEQAVRLVVVQGLDSRDSSRAEAVLTTSEQLQTPDRFRPAADCWIACPVSHLESASGGIETPYLCYSAFDPLLLCVVCQVRHACWAAGQPTPYLHIASALQAMDSTTKRLRIADVASNMFRSVLALTPGCPPPPQPHPPPTLTARRLQRIQCIRPTHFMLQVVLRGTRADLDQALAMPFCILAFPDL